MKGIAMIPGIYKTYTKELVIRDEAPTKETLEETFKQYKAKSPKDWLVTAHLHLFAVRKLQSGFIDGPGTYRLSVTVKVPMMFWYNTRTKIVKL